MFTKEQLSLLINLMKENHVLPRKYHFQDNENLYDTTDNQYVLKSVMEYLDKTNKPNNHKLNELIDTCFLIINISDALMTTNVNALINRSFLELLPNELDFSKNIISNDMFDDILDTKYYTAMVLGNYIFQKNSINKFRIIDEYPELFNTVEQNDIDFYEKAISIDFLDHERLSTDTIDVRIDTCDDDRFVFSVLINKPQVLVHKENLTSIFKTAINYFKNNYELLSKQNSNHDGVMFMYGPDLND